MIKGLIRDSQNHPLPNIAVKAFDKDPLSSDLPGISTSDIDGKFEMIFSEDQYDFFRIEGEPRCGKVFITK